MRDGGSSSTEDLSKGPEELVEEERNRILNKKCVYIVVLGDIGRSPRMRYHALSFAKEGYFVQMIGYGGSAVPEDLSNNPAIWTHCMREPPEFLQGIKFNDPLNLIVL